MADVNAWDQLAAGSGTALEIATRTTPTLPATLAGLIRALGLQTAGTRPPLDQRTAVETDAVVSVPRPAPGLEYIATVTSVLRSQRAAASSVMGTLRLTGNRQWDAMTETVATNAVSATFSASRVSRKTTLHAGARGRSVTIVANVTLTRSLTRLATACRLPLAHAWDADALRTNAHAERLSVLLQSVVSTGEVSPWVTIQG